MAARDRARPVAFEPRPRWRSPLGIVAALIALIALVVVGGAAFLLLPRPAAQPGPSGPAAPGTTTAAGILVPAKGTPTNIAFQRTLGRPDAPVRLIFWGDFQCAGCKDFVDNSLPNLITDYVIPGKLRVEWRDLAVVGPESPAAAAAARCAADQDRFWPYLDVLFANQAPENSGALVPARLKAMADAVGLDRTKFDACLPSGTLFNDIQGETTQGKGRGSSVPVLDFGSVVIDGSPRYDSLRQTMQQLLAAAPTPAGSAHASASGSTAP